MTDYLMLWIGGPFLAFSAYGVCVLLHLVVKAILPPMITSLNFEHLKRAEELNAEFLIPPSFSTLLKEATAREILQYYDVRSLWDRICGRRVGLAVIRDWFILMIQDRASLTAWAFPFLNGRLFGVDGKTRSLEDWYYCPYRLLDWTDKWLRKKWTDASLAYMSPTGDSISTIALPNWSLGSVRRVVRMARLRWKPPADVMHEEGPYR
jgi:hypothetical protein